MYNNRMYIFRKLHLKKSILKNVAIFFFLNIERSDFFFFYDILLTHGRALLVSQVKSYLCIII